MKVLFVSNLFPDTGEPNRGIFNARLVRYLARHCEIRVIAPRPTRGFPPFWLPKKSTGRAEDAAFAPIFPPVSYIPVIGSHWNHRLMAKSLRKTVRAMRREFPFDLILVAWAYPDACAVAELAQEMNCPFIACAQGSDVHQYLQIPERRRIITSALARAEAVITCSGELARQLQQAGVKESKLHTIYYGVETDLFHPGDKAAARAELNLPPEEKVLLFVGNFLPIKNPLLLVDAFAELTRRQPHRAFRLVLLGDGPLRGDIQRRASAAGLAGRVSLPGRKAPAAVARFMQAVDVLCVPSDNEGLPNVIYEAISCGLPVVATRVGGIPEIMTADYLGRLVERGNSPALAEAIAAVLAAPVVLERIVGHARQFSWERTAEEHRQILEAVSSQSAGTDE